MANYRVKFAKEGSACYMSHLDLMRTWERSLRRAGLDLAFSEGFNPHPKISFAQALALGVSSKAEYLDVVLNALVDPKTVQRQLNQVLPEGIHVLELALMPEQEAPAMSQVEAAAYLLIGTSQEAARWEKGIISLQQRGQIVIVRDGKKGLREMDIASLILDLQVEEINDGCVTLFLLASAGSRGNLRPQEVLQALNKYEGLLLSEQRMSRVGLYRRSGNRFVPLIVGEQAFRKVQVTDDVT